MTDARLYSPSAQRNREPILAVLRDVLPKAGAVLEIGSGSGEHAAYLAEQFPSLEFQPTDPDPDALASIAAWRDHAGLPNLREPLRLDASAPTWPVERADAIICINMMHISPWAATVGLLEGARRCLARWAPLYLYGPYRRSGLPTAPSNEAFDKDLRARNPDWGLRDLTTLTVLAAAYRFPAPDVTEMPANNLSLVFRRL